VALILASASPQRTAILEALGIAHRVVPSQADELTEGPPDEVALENAYRKAHRVAGSHPDATVLGVDTIVVLGPRIYGKPASRDEAAATLRALAARTHTVISGVCLIEAGRARTAAAATRVSFRRLDEATLDWYLAGGEWEGRAGGYAIQGRGMALVAAIDGDYSNVVGLPVATLLDLAPSLLSG
jgi:septum formation protein